MIASIRSVFPKLFLLLTALPCLLRAQTTVTLTTSPNPSTFGAPVVMTATVTPATATGKVTFYDGVTVLGTKSLVSGAASLSTIALPAGTRHLRAYYSGAVSNVVTQSVHARPDAAVSAKPPVAAIPSASLLLVGPDFNGDGHADIVLFGNGLLEISLGDGAGNFQPVQDAVQISLTGLPSSVAAVAGDFNGDGILDLAVFYNGQIGILLGKGDGSFQPQVNYPAPGIQGPATVGDFNGDGKTDLAVSDGRAGVDILLGNGDGTFQTAVNYSISPPPSSLTAVSLVVADFNGDGKADLAAVSVTNRVIILLGNGDGTFQPPVNPVILANPNQVHLLFVDDFNGDGKMDLATSNFVGGTDILLGNGDGTFQPSVSYSTSAPLGALRDFNGDGIDDLICFFSNGNNSFDVLLGKGDGTFQPQVNYAFAPSGYYTAAGEFNGDGRTDFAIIDINGNLTILLGTTVTVTPTAGTPQSTAVGTPFAIPLQVVVQDGGTPLGGVTVTFAECCFPAAALSSTTATTDVNGVASVMATADAQTGHYTVTATALGVSALFSLTNIPGPPSVITPTPALPQGTLVGTAFAQPLQVKLTDSFGFASLGVTVTFTAPTSGASAVLSAATVVTDSTGSASVMATANGIPGAYTVTARAGGLSATFSLTNLQPAGLTLSSSPNPSTFGAPVSLTATLNPAATGSVTFYDGVTVLGTKPLASGSASFSTILLPAGNRQLRAYYGGDANYAAATSNALTQPVKAVAGGALIPQTPLSLPAVPSSVALGDFNGDGKVDFAFAGNLPDMNPWWQVDLGASAAIGSVVIWNRTDCCGSRLSDYWVFISNTPFLATDTPATLQNRPGTFASHQTVAPSPSATIAAGGAQGPYVRVQLTQTNYLSLAEVQVFGVQSGTNLALGKPATQSSTYQGLTQAGAAAAVDGNTDGNFGDGSVSTTDVTIAGVTVALGKGDGTYRTAVTYGTGLTSASSVAVGDFNGDGIADLAVSGIVGTVNAPAASLSILLGNGDGTFRPAVNYPAGSLNPVLAGMFPAPAGTVGSVTVGDFNGDGKADVLVTYTISALYLCGDEVGYCGVARGSEVNVVSGNGDGTFAAPAYYAVPGVPFLVADFNGDGKPDVAAASGVYLSGGGFTSINVSLAPPLFAADFNGDGKTDLAFDNFILLGKGDGTLQTLIFYAGLGLGVLPGDFNGDGIIDIVVTDASGNLAGVLYGNGDGTFRQGIVVTGGVPLAVADFNGDGRADILTVNPATGAVTIVLGAAGASFSVVATGGALQSATIGSAFPLPLQVQVLNNGVPVTGATVFFTPPAGGITAILSSPTAVTNSLGIASVTAMANYSGGSYTVTASYQGMTALFSLTNIAPAFLAATGGTPQSAPLNGAFPSALQATVRDSAGNPLSGIYVSFAVPTLGSSAILSSPTAVTNASGVASVTGTANGFAGSYMVTAFVGSISASFSLTNVSGANSNLALGKTATQSSTLPGYPAPAPSAAVDGNTDGDFLYESVTATNLDTNAWWQVDLGSSATVGSVVVWNRTDCCSSRLGDYWVFISDTPFLAADTPLTLQNRAGTFGSHQTTAPNPSTIIAAGAQGRYVRIQLTGANYLSLAEVQVFGTVGPPVSNLSQGKPASQSSTLPGSATAGASAAVDGNTDGSFYDGSVTATNLDPSPWWQVDLGASASVSSIVIWNRTDCCSSRLNDYWVFVSDTPFLATDTPATLQNRTGTFASHQTVAPNPSTTITASAQGGYVRVQLTNAGYLSLAEVQVFGTGAPAISNLAQGKAATESSTLPGTPPASVAVDGNTDGNFYDGSVTATNLDANPWWQVDLGASASVSSIVVWNRTDCCGSRLGDYWVFVSDTPFLATDTPVTLQNRAGTFGSHQTSAPNPSATIAAGGAEGRYVRVQLTSANYLSLAEVQVFGQ